MNYIWTLLFTFLLVIVVLWVFVRVGTPVYRLESSNVIRLLEMVIANEATESDWSVFIGMPIRYDPELELIRKRCAELTERELISAGNTLFTEVGINELSEILNGLKIAADKEKSAAGKSDFDE